MISERNLQNLPDVTFLRVDERFEESYDDYDEVVMIFCFFFKESLYPCNKQGYCNFVLDFFLP